MPTLITRIDSALLPGLDGQVSPAGAATLDADTLALQQSGGAGGRLWLIFPAVELPKYHRAVSAQVRLTAAAASGLAATLTASALAERDPQQIGSAADLAARATVGAAETAVAVLAEDDSVTLDVTSAVNALLEQLPPSGQPRALGLVIDIEAAGDVTLTFDSGEQATEANRPELTLELESILNIWEGDAPETASQLQITVNVAVPFAIYRIEFADFTVAYQSDAGSTTTSIAAELAEQLAEHGETTRVDNVITWTSDQTGAPADFFTTGGASQVTELVAGRAAVAQKITIALPPTVTGGTWDLDMNFGSGTESANGLAHNITAAALQTTLEGLATPAPGDVTVEQVATFSWRVTLTGALLGTNATADVDETNLTFPAGDVEVGTIQNAATTGPAYDLYLWHEFGDNFNAGTAQPTKRRFRLGAGAWTAWLSMSPTAIEAALQALVDPLDADVVNVETSIRGDDFEYRAIAVRMPTGYDGLEAETDLVGDTESMTTVATNTRRAMFLLQPPNGLNCKLTGWINADSEAAGGTLFETNTWNDKAALIAELDEHLGAGNYTLHTPIILTPDELEHFALTFAGDWLDRLAHVDPPQHTSGLDGESFQVAAGTPNDNQIDIVEIAGPGVTSFTLMVNGAETAAIDNPTTAAAIDAALAALLGQDNAIVTEIEPGAYQVEWTGAFEGDAVFFDVGSVVGGDGSAQVSYAPGSAAANEKQRIIVDSTATGGTLRASDDGNDWSAPFAYDAAAATVETALEAIYGAGNVDVSDAAGLAWDVEFIGDLAAQPIDMLLLDQDALEADGGLLSILELARGGGPNRWDTADNWSLGEIPGTHHVACLADGDIDITGGYVQAADFTAEAGSTLLTLSTPCQFEVGQCVRLRSTGTLPSHGAGALSTNRDYFVNAVNRIKGTLKLAAVQGGGALTITDAGEGIHSVAVQLRGLHHRMAYSGAAGLTRRDEDGVLETRPQYVTIGFLESDQPNVLLGLGEGSGAKRLNIDLHRSPAYVQILNSGGGSAETPAVLLKGLANNVRIETIGGEAGYGVQPGEACRFARLSLFAGALTIGRDVAADAGALVDKYADATLIAEEITLAGAVVRFRA